ncbi:MAG: MmgE/PrpD family protein [Dehalococcoidia bacterium]|nr:MmgE/PrpD family protein [Dehalococcoidia bacterium]
MVTATNQILKGQTARLVDLALSTEFSDIPAEVVRDTKRIILDTVGCTVAAFATDTGRMIVDLKRQQGGVGEATLLVHGDRLPVSSAAYVHSQLANLLDLDETLLHRTHYASSIVMPALAMAELTGASGQEVIAAVALGFDIGGRIGLSMPFYETPSEGMVQFASTWGYSWAAFGTAVAAGRLLGLSHEQMANALGIAYVSTPVPFNSPKRKMTGAYWGARPMHKYAMYGAIAEAGINAVRLATRGFTGDTAVLDADQAFWTSFGTSPADWDYMMSDLGRKWLISEASLKFYPVCRQGSIPVDLFSTLVRKEGLSSDEIEGVTVKIPPAQVVMGLYDNESPPSQVGPMPVPHALALVAAGIESSLKWVSHDTLHDPEIRSFAMRVKSELMPEWYPAIVDQVKAEGTYRRIPIEVVIKARGKSFTAYAEYAKGDPWGPEPMTDDELAVKFVNYTGDLIGRANADRAITAALNLDSAPNVHQLIGALHL